MILILNSEYIRESLYRAASRGCQRKVKLSKTIESRTDSKLIRSLQVGSYTTNLKLFVNFSGNRTMDGVSVVDVVDELRFLLVKDLRYVSEAFGKWMVCSEEEGMRLDLRWKYKL